jgi:hypothetical protein
MRKNCKQNKSKQAHEEINRNWKNKEKNEAMNSVPQVVE